MAVRFRSYQFETLYGNQFKIEISDSSFSGTVFEFDLESPGFELNWAGDETDRHNAISASTLKFYMIQNNPTLRNFVNDLATGNEKRFTVAVYKGSSLFWAGHIIPDASDLQDLENRVFTVSAACGLGTLKKIEYLNAGSPYTGQARIIDVIARCLKLIPHVPDYFSAADPFVVTSDNCYEAQHTVSATYDPLYYTYIDQGMFYKYDSNGGQTPWNAYDVLRECLFHKMLNVRLSEGIWRINQVETYAFTSNWRKYAYAIGAPAAYTAPGTLGGNPTNPRTGITYGHLAPINQVKVTQKLGALRNLILGDVFSSDAAGPFTHSVFCDGENSTLQFTGNLEWRLTNDAITGLLGVNYAHFLVFTFTLKIGSYWLRRTINFVANSATATQFKWVGIPGPSKLATKMINTLPDVTESTYDTTPFNYIFGLHPSHTNGQTMEISFGFDGLYRSTGVLVDPADYTLTWKVFDPYFILVSEPTDKAAKIAPKSEITYKASNATPGNTSALEYDTEIGDPEDLNGHGFLHYYNGSQYLETADWGMRSAGGSGKLISLVAARIAAGQAVPLQTMNGSVDGASIYQLAHVPREEGSKKWQLAQGTYTAQTDRFSGSWYALSYTDGEPTIETPPYNPADYELGRPPGPSIFTPGKSVTFEPQFVGAMVADIGRITYTNEFLPEGAFTAFDVTDALAGGEIYAGDTLFIFNPATNVSVECTVSANVADGATSISASGTAPEGGLPVNSPVIYGWASRFQQGGSNGFQVADTATIDHTFTAATNTLTSDIVTNSVGNTHIRQSSGLSVIGRAANTTGNVADITAGSDGQVLRRSGTSLAFGQVGTLGIADDAVTYAKIQNVTSSRILGRSTAGSGDVEEISIGSGLSLSGGVLSATGGGSGFTTAENGLTAFSSTVIRWGGTLVQDTTITQSGFRIRFTGHYTGIHKTSNNPTPRAVLSVDGLSVAAPTSVATPAEDSFATFTGTSGGTQVDTQLRIGGYSTATNGNWMQGSSITDYSVFRPLRIQPLGGKVGIGKFGATPPTAYCTVFGSGLGTSGLSASTLHVAHTGETSTNARISLGVNDTLQALMMYDGTAVAMRHHVNISGTSVTARWSFGTTEWDDVMVLQPSVALSSARLGVGFSDTTGLHSTVHSAGSFAAGMLETSGAPTFDETKHTVVYTASTNVTWTLPSASSCTGRVYWLNHAGSGGTITLSSSVSSGNGVTFSTLAAGEWARITAGIGSWRGKKW